MALLLYLTTMTIRAMTFIAGEPPQILVSISIWPLRSLLLKVNIDKVDHVMGADVRELVQTDPALDCRQHLRELVDRTDPVFQRNCLLCCDQVQLVQNDLVSEGNLLVSFVYFAFL